MLNYLLFNVRCVLFHFFRAIVKFCVVFVVGIIQRAITVNYGRTSTEITKLHTTPTIENNYQSTVFLITEVKIYVKTKNQVFMFFSKSSSYIFTQNIVDI